MPNLPNNQIVLDQSNRGKYPLEHLETWETGAHEWRSLQKDNPSYFHAIPHKDGKFSVQEYQANGHLHEITNSSKITQQDSASDGTTNNMQKQVGGGIRNVTGQGEHRERGADDTKAVAGSTIAISKDTHTHISNEHGHHAVKGDYGFYVKGGGYSVGAEQQMVVTSQDTIHMEAEGEMSLKGIKNAAMTTKGKLTLDSKEDMLANTSSDFAANAAGNFTANCGGDMITNAGGNMTISAGQSMTLKVGSSSIVLVDGVITLKSGQVKVNNVQLTPTSNIFV
jgi:hypothetical protein